MNHTFNNIDDIFQAFNKLNALIIGDVMIDAYLWGKVERISPEAPVPIVAVNKRENRLGGAANVALNVKAMGANPILCAVIGDDDKGDTFYRLLQEKELPTEGIIRSKERVTTTKFRIIGNNAQMLRVDEEIESNINASDTEKLYKTIETLVNQKKADVIIFEDYDKGVITHELIHKVVDLAVNNNIPVTVDPKKRNFLAYNNVTLFKPNLKELKEGLKLDFSNKDFIKIAEAASMLQHTLNAKYALITMSELGVLINTKTDNNRYEHEIIPAHIRNIADVSGAGDTVISVASLCLALKLNQNFTAAVSNLAGGLVCEEIGAVPVNKEKLLNETKRLDKIF